MRAYRINYQANAVFLATDVEGIFRLNGSAKRIKELQTAFDSPVRYGKGLDWTGYTVHDAANVLRRYLNNLPQPIIPLEFYERFREPLRDQHSHSGTDGTIPEIGPDFDHEKAIVTYQQLITEVPALNRQLLLYILDLLAVFASKSDINLMTSANLSAIFQPGVLSHPTHDMNPAAYRLSQDVLVFLIDNQDSFDIGKNGTPTDEKTIKEVQTGAGAPQPASPSRPHYGRAPSSGSLTGDGKRFSGIRRNVSTSSRNSKRSSQGPSTPLSDRFASSSVYRSNTVPSKKSPALPTSRFNRGVESPNTPIALSPAINATTTSPLSLPALEPRNADQSGSPQPTKGLGLSQPATPPGKTAAEEIKETEGQTPGPNQYLAAPKARNISDVLLNLTAGGDKEGRLPNKLKKKRMPGASENSSATSLLAVEQSPGFSSARSPSRTPEITSGSQNDPPTSVVSDTMNTTPTMEEAEPSTPIPIVDSGATAVMTVAANDEPKAANKSNHAYTVSDLTARPRSVSRTSGNSKSSITDLSEFDHDQNDEARAESREKKRRWRFPQSAKPSKSPARMGSNVVADRSSSSVGSWQRSGKSISNDAGSPTFETIPSLPMTTTIITGGSEPRSKQRDRSRDKDAEDDKEEKKGFFDKIKRRVTQAREDKKDRDAEKDRVKNPLQDTDKSNSKHSLSAIATDASYQRPSIVQQTILEQREAEASPVHTTMQAEAAPAPAPAVELDAIENATIKNEIPTTETTAPTQKQPTEEAPQPTQAIPAAAVLISGMPESLASESHDQNEQEGKAPIHDANSKADQENTTSGQIPSATASSPPIEPTHENT